MTDCDKCKDLNIVFPIKLPGELEQAIRITKQNIEDNTIGLVETGQWCRPFAEVSESGDWDDILSYMLCHHEEIMNSNSHLAAIFLLVASAPTSALDVTEFNARAVDLSGSKAVLNAHESVLLGLSCKSGPVGTLQGVSVVKLGDTVTAGGKSFRVGLIQVTKYNEDAKWGKEILARKGDVVCVLAPDEKSLPYDDNCEAIWVNAPGCRVLE